MQILSFNFLLYALSGVWRPIGWSSRCSKLLYGLFTFSTLYLLNFSMLTQLMDIVLVVDNTDDFATTSLMSITAIATFYKAVVAVTRRSEIINLIRILKEAPCKPNNREEMNIQMRYDDLIRSCSINYTLLASFSATGATIGEVLAVLHGELPYRGWVPYDTYSSHLLFLFTSLQEMLALIFGTIVNIATGEAYEDLFDDESRKTSRLSNHIHYHLRIIRFAKMVNKVFSQMLFVQFFASILILCSSVYYLSSHKTVEDFVKLGVYTFCMFVQIFVYCWAGNEVILQSTGLSEAVYEINWLLMTTSEQKDLIMIMKRSTRPIKFTSSFLVTLSLESYVNILKTSYSAFNILQQY